MKKIFLLGLFCALFSPLNATPYPIHKYTCQGEKCSDGELVAVKLVNKKYWEMLSERIKENKFYKYPWYWVYQKDVFNECKYTVAAKEDMRTHTANMEWIDVDICKKTTKLIDLGRRR